jgi:UDP-N-acetylglucosamine 2-epimerase (non-hydrolysing)
MDTLTELSQRLTIIFPLHPRTRQRLRDLDANLEASARLKLLEPLPYLEFLALQRHAAMVITDSGGVQEETSFLGVPCLTVRENTERPITLTLGTNQLVGRDLQRLRDSAEAILRQKRDGAVSSARFPLWDGHAAERIADVIWSTSNA